MEVCASVLARACKSVAGEVVAANGGAAGSPVPLPGELHRRGGRERSSRGAERSGPEAPAGPGLSRSLELGVPQEEE